MGGFFNGRVLTTNAVRDCSGLMHWNWKVEGIEIPDQSLYLLPDSFFQLVQKPKVNLCVM